MVCISRKKDTKNTIILSSWKEAITSCSGNDWQDLLLEASNRYTEKLAKVSKERFNAWNQVAEEVKKVTVPLVNNKTYEVAKENHLPQIFIDTVQWVIFHLAMEVEYADVISPGFFAAEGYWYTHGHFPCGWEGAFPEGKLIIY